MKKILLIASLIFGGLVASAQTTSVTATITDSDSQTWNNGTWQAVLTNVANPNGPYYLDGVQLTTAQLQKSGSMSSSGVITGTFYDTVNHITPNGSVYLFTLCPNASAPCVTGIGASPTGASINLSSTLSANLKGPRFAATGANAYGYLTTEVSPIPRMGGFFFNVTLDYQQIWNGSTWITSSGSGGPPTGTAGGALAGTYPNPSLAIPSLPLAGGQQSSGTYGLLSVSPSTASANANYTLHTDSAGVIRSIDLFPSSIVDNGNTATVGSIEWAIVQLGSNASTATAGSINLACGIYTYTTSILVDYDWIAIRGCNTSHWNKYNGSYPTLATPGAPGGSQITPNSTVTAPAFTVGSTCPSQCHGDTRHHGLEWSNLYLYGAGTATQGILDAQSGTDVEKILSNTFEGFTTYAISTTADAHWIQFNNIQMNQGGGIFEDGLAGHDNFNIVFDGGGTFGIDLGGYNNEAIGNEVGDYSYGIIIPNGAAGNNLVVGNVLSNIANWGVVDSSGLTTNTVIGNSGNTVGQASNTQGISPNSIPQFRGRSYYGNIQIIPAAANAETDIMFAASQVVGNANWFAGTDIGNTSGNFQLWYNSTTPFSLTQAGNLALLGSINVAAARKGTFVCTSGGAITVANTNYLITSDVLITTKTPGGTQTYAPNITAQSTGVSFTVTCAALDTSTYNYDILN
jgi:hypothetical protein